MKRSSGDVCDKCDGAHPSHQCPHYPLARDPSQPLRKPVPQSEERPTKRQHAEEDKSYLKSLSQEQRDEVLAKISYVKDPVDHLFSIDVSAPTGYVINYSQWYATMNEEYKTKTKIPAPSKLCNGDRLQFGDYRGVNCFYVLWLRRGSYTNEDGFDNEHVAAVLERSTHRECEFSAHPRQLLETAELPDMPLMLKRSDTNGPHSNPEYECYLFIHPDEFGYSPAMVVSSAPLNYYRPEIILAFIDPLLTHSESEHGRAIAEAAVNHSSDDFPQDYIGILDENNDPDMTWEQLLDGDEFDSDFDFPPGYIKHLRGVMEKHFRLELEEA